MELLPSPQLIIIAWDYLMGLFYNSHPGVGIDIIAHEFNTFEGEVIFPFS